jgi:hypothetical protein
MTSQFWWYVARSGGVVAWGLATASVLWGLALSSGILGNRAEPAKLLDLHRFLGGLSVVFALIHIGGLALDDTIKFGPSELFVPMASKWEPGAVAWGVVALYLLIAVEITSLLRTRLSDEVWRVAHLGGFGVFLLGTIHGLRAGTDVENPLIWWPAAIASAAVVGLCVYRFFSGDPVHVPEKSDFVSAALLERTLTELERLDTNAYPSHPVPASPPPPVPAAPAAATPPAPPAARTPVPDGPMFPDAAPAARAPAQPPVPSRTPISETLLARSLPTRTPQRLAATTAPASGLGQWTPTRRRTDTAGGPPPPPDAVDPSTGEPDPQAYRKWLRDWLAYVESQP